MLSYYELLGVTSKATKAEIKSAFKEKALLYHPDRHFGNTEKEEHFKLLNEAYQTLTDDYARAKYDLLRYSHTTHTSHQDYQTSDTNYSRSEATERPRYKSKYMRSAPKINSKENIRATAYAFLFALVVAIIVKSFIYGLEMYRALENAEVLESRRAFYEVAQKKYRQDSMVRSLELMTSMGRFYSEEADMYDFKEFLIKKIRMEGDQFFEEQKYDQALNRYEALQAYTAMNSVSYMKKVAFAYKEVGDINRAIGIYRTMQLYGYQSMDFYYEMGILYEEGLGNYEQSLKYYQISADKAVDSYKGTIGEAYPIVINANMIPKKHYDIYMKVTEMKFKAGLYEEAIKSVEWSKGIWPDSSFQYQIEIKSLAALNLDSEKNKVIEQAREHIPSFDIED